MRIRDFPEGFWHPTDGFKGNGKKTHQQCYRITLLTCFLNLGFTFSSIIDFF